MKLEPFDKNINEKIKGNNLERGKNYFQKEKIKPLKYGNWIVGTVIKTSQGKNYYATPWQFIKRMMMIAIESFRHPFYNGDIKIDQETGRIFKN